MTLSMKQKLEISVTVESGSTPFLLQMGFVAEKVASSATNIVLMFVTSVLPVVCLFVCRN
jgi:hypothetical protein